MRNITNSTSFIGGGNNITNVNISPTDIGDLTYLYTNITKKADIISGGNTATFTGASMLQPGPLSSLPPTTVNNFTFYINGQYAPSSLVTLVEDSGNIILTFNTVSLGYDLESDEEVLAIGKFQ